MHGLMRIGTCNKPKAEMQAQTFISLIKLDLQEWLCLIILRTSLCFEIICAKVKL